MQGINEHFKGILFQLLVENSHPLLDFLLGNFEDFILYQKGESEDLFKTSKLLGFAVLPKNASVRRACNRNISLSVKNWVGGIIRTFFYRIT